MALYLENAYALIIGVDKNNIANLALPAVARDVQALYAVLTHPERCGYKKDNVKLISGEEATGANITATLDWLRDQVAQQPNATAVIYYSGHGAWHGQRYYLIPYDIKNGDSVDAICNAAVKAEEFAGKIADITPQRLLVILDCCHAAGMDVKDVGFDIPGLQAAAFPLELPAFEPIPDLDAGGKNLRALAKGAGRAILSSSTGNESSYVRSDGKMSVFTYHLIEALTGYAPHDGGDETVLVTDVMSYVTRRVAETIRAEGLKQTPVMKTTGVFPIAMLLGGAGTKGMPDPLASLPPSVTFNQQGQVVHGKQINIGRDATIGQIGDRYVTGGGDYVKGNKTEKTTTVSGDLRGAIVNIDSRLENVQQAIHNIPGGREEKEALAAAVAELQIELERVPALWAEEAERLAGRVAKLLEEAKDKDPDPVAIRSFRDRVLESAEKLAAGVEKVLPLAQTIVRLITKMLPFAL